LPLLDEWESSSRTLPGKTTRLWLMSWAADRESSTSVSPFFPSPLWLAGLAKRLSRELAKALSVKSSARESSDFRVFA
jgi:hypothetical protein